MLCFLVKSSGFLWYLSKGDIKYTFRQVLLTHECPRNDVIVNTRSHHTDVLYQNARLLKLSNFVQQSKKVKETWAMVVCLKHQHKLNLKWVLQYLCHHHYSLADVMSFSVVWLSLNWQQSIKLWLLHLSGLFASSVFISKEHKYQSKLKQKHLDKFMLLVHVSLVQCLRTIMMRMKWKRHAYQSEIYPD